MMSPRSIGDILGDVRHGRLPPHRAGREMRALVGTPVPLESWTERADRVMERAGLNISDEVEPDSLDAVMLAYVRGHLTDEMYRGIVEGLTEGDRSSETA